ncbi:MAG TPA: hypothetical protein DDY78_29080 [Planctomycetales bacterium]|jgi:hypothetical protein|nr:hypothetical protein [Planctomycetales bacterium]
MPGKQSERRRLWAAVVCLILAAAARADALPKEEAAPPAPAAHGDALPSEQAPSPAPEASTLLPSFFTHPLGFAGRSSVLPKEHQETPDFVPIEDRWRVGFLSWDRYDKGHPPVDDYPYQEGHWWDPFNQNIFKGDYPISGQNTFLNLTAESITVLNAREVPTQTTPFESTARPHQSEFFGRPGQFFYNQNFSFTVDLFHGDAAFKPVDWRILITPVFNLNSLNLNELAQVNPDVRKGTGRERTFFALQEWFVERKLADLSPDYDFVSVRVGSQPFTSDFRGFLFSDVNTSVRLFGTLESNREQFNLIAFDQQEKDTNSQLNEIGTRRRQQILIGNFFRQDFIWPGYTAQASVHYNHDQPSFHFNKNDVLVRPDPVGVFTPHQLDVAYLGWAGDGHINRFNITHQFYWALGRDSLNPIANQAQDISAEFFAAELSYDRDWVRFRTSVLYASGEGKVNNKHATGFDSILDDQQFAGGEFSYWQRQAIPLFGVQLKNAGSLLADLRSSKIEGQSNFVNPGLNLFNIGMDMDLTPKWKSISNVNFLAFDKTNSLETFLFQERIHRFIGTDISTGMEYRPLLSNNIIAKFGVSTLIPGQGFSDLYDRFRGRANSLFASFVQITLAY